ncbi:MAG TPA: hypothetical protein VMU27_03650 [Candidatus Paceibacterota bacterium]|nr:hypothetical protein [Candidatus Paceibacterota bacterium]
MRALSTIVALSCAIASLGTLIVPEGEASAAISTWQKSISIYPESPTDFGSAGFDQVVQQMKELGFNYVTLVIPYYQSTIYSSDVGPGGNTPTDSSLIAAVQYVHAEGMGVVFKLHLDPEDGNWRANINAGDRASWFGNYQAALMKYAGIAQQYGVEEFCIGTELISMSSSWINGDNTTQWEHMIESVRGVYSGKLFYDANWGGDSFANEAPQIGFWSKLDFLGISAYYNLDGDNSVSNLENDWSAINSADIAPLEQQFGKPILFSEVGYRSVLNAHNEPWNSGMGGGYDAQEQVNDYTALFQYWNNYPYLQGVGIWYAIGNSGAGGSGDTDYLIQNKPAEQTIQQYFLTPPNPGDGGSNPPSGNAQFSLSGSAPSTAATGQAVAMNVSVADQDGSVANATIDIEVYNSAGTRVYQKFYGEQNFGAGQSQSYSASWTPPGTGTYTLKVGVFSGDWSTLYTWNNSAATISVGNSPPPSGPQTISVWWPINNVTVSGTQPFKAVVNNLSTSAYTMYWQVDGGALNQMQPANEGGAHEEALVSVAAWEWHGSGPYTVTFVAKDGTGATIAQQSVPLYVAQ